MSDGTVGRLEPHEIALLGEGPRAAVTVAVVDLHLRGLAEAGRPGTVRAVIADAMSAERPPPPLAQAVYDALHEPADLRTLVKDPGVLVALADMRVPLAGAGLLRYPLLGATRGARRQVRALRQRPPLASPAAAPSAAHEQTRPDGPGAAARHRAARRGGPEADGAALRSAGGAGPAGRSGRQAPPQALAAQHVRRRWESPLLGLGLGLGRGREWGRRWGWGRRRRGLTRPSARLGRPRSGGPRNAYGAARSSRLRISTAVPGRGHSGHRVLPLRLSEIALPSASAGQAGVRGRTMEALTRRDAVLE